MTLKEDWQHQMKMLEGKSAKEKIAWFFEYYKIHMIVIGATAAFLIAILYSAFTNKESKAGLIFVNAQTALMPDDTEEWIDKPLAEYIGLDTDKYSVATDLTEYMTPGTTTDQYEMYAQEKIMVEIASGTIDVLCADAWNFASYAANGTFRDLREILTDEQIEKYQDKFYYVDNALIEVRVNEAADTETVYPSGTIADNTDPETAAEAESEEGFVLPDPSTMTDPVPVGIVFTDSPFFKEYDLYTGVVPIVGLVTSEKNEQTASAMVDWLWEH